MNFIILAFVITNLVVGGLQLQEGELLGFMNLMIANIMNNWMRD